LGFDVISLMPDKDPFFAMVRRGTAQILVKAVAEEVLAMPNQTRHKWAPWDAFVYVDEPLSLVKELIGRETPLHQEVHNRDDGLCGFEVKDLDGYVLFFGSPI